MVDRGGMVSGSFQDMVEQTFEDRPEELPFIPYEKLLPGLGGSKRRKQGRRADRRRNRRLAKRAEARASRKRNR